jgi:hypothetical protein
MAWSTGYSFFWGGIATDGTYLYAGTDTTITKTDLATGVILDSSWATGFNQIGYLAIYNNYIYAADYFTNIIYKIDIANPGSPQIFISDPLISSPVGIIVVNGYLYVANSGQDYISKISLTDPFGPNTNLLWVKNSLINQSLGICIYNNLMYVTSRGSSYSGGRNTLSTINLTTFAITVLNVFTYVQYSIVIYNNILYTTNYNNGTIKQLDLNGNIINSSWATTTSNSDGLCINRTYLYCSDDGNPNGSIYKFLLTPELFQSIACFKEGTKILTSRGYRRIEDLRKGDLIKTVLNDHLPIDMIGKREIYHYALKENRIKDQLYKCSSYKYPEIFEDLVITGCHSILVNKFKDEKEKEKTIKINGNIYTTNYKYRLPACVDERAVVYEKAGIYTIYHIALENNNYYTNYGIYANGLLVETCSKRYLKELSKMTIF